MRSSRLSSLSSIGASAPRSPCSAGHVRGRPTRISAFGTFRATATSRRFPGSLSSASTRRSSSRTPPSSATRFGSRRVEHPPPRAILVDATAVTHVDTTAIDMIAELDDELAAGRSLDVRATQRPDPRYPHPGRARRAARPGAVLSDHRERGRRVPEQPRLAAPSRAGSKSHPFRLRNASDAGDTLAALTRKGWPFW